MPLFLCFTVALTTSLPLPAFLPQCKAKGVRAAESRTNLAEGDDPKMEALGGNRELRQGGEVHASPEHPDLGRELAFPR
jgi:hypothetical protein